MNYRVRRRGDDLGVFLLEELRSRRESGELTGGEYVQAEGMSDWQPLDLVLQQGYRLTPPPLPSSVSGSGPSRTVIWCIVVGGVFFFLLVVGLMINQARKGYSYAINHARDSNLNMPRPQALTAASKPVLWTTNTLTQTDASRRAREFRIRQWLDGYEKRGLRNPADDGEIVEFIQTWIARNYGGNAATNPMSLTSESDRLAADVNCTDPLVLTVVANESRNNADITERFERALAAYPDSQHKAYPKLYATVWLAGYFGKAPQRVSSLDSSALELLPKCFADGSFTPDDQQEIAEIFVNGWGYNFFQRNSASVCDVVHAAGPDYQWLALTLDGEREIAEAWAARGNGYANSVTDQGWQGFHQGLKQARESLTQAWNLRPDFPLAPCRMMTVALGDSDITEMRLWFDRTTSAQIDYPGAWVEMRWGLRPRWYGNEAAMLALGKTAVATGRFDTDVPRKFVDCVYDVESEMDLPRGQHIFGRSDIWPEFEKLYQGYINAPSQTQHQNGWRSSYAIIAYYAGKYDIARAQLEALDWKPKQDVLSEWNLNPALWPLEVAARGGPIGKKVSAAEALYQNGNSAGALKKYKELNSDMNADARTKEFIQKRLESLGAGGYLINPQEYSIPSINRTN
jgi:hypothetical protein